MKIQGAVVLALQVQMELVAMLNCAVLKSVPV
jgi:hypothetical protein